MKKYLLFIIVLLNCASLTFAADVYWNNNAGDGNWNTPSNWGSGSVPNTTSDNARIEMATGPVFSSGRSATAFRVFLRGSGNGVLTIDGGSLTANNYMDMAYTSTESGTLTINSGSLTLSGSSSHFYCGRAGNATFNMNGGTMDIGGTFYVGRDATSVANVNLAGGTISCAGLSMRTNGGTGTINITNSGKLIITGDVTSTIATYVTSGWIKSYNGAGTVMKDYGVTTAGKTTVWASVPTKAGNPSPANAATNVSILADLSWTAASGATSHNVYFGTASPGTLQTSTTSTTYDVGRLNPNTTYYWRIDEVIGSNTITGDVWSFTTGALTATNPTPANASLNVGITGTALTWTAGVTAASHNIYFGTSNPPAYATNQTAASYTLGTLATDKTYYWRIDEVEDGTHIYTGTVWSFSTQGSIKKGPYLIYGGNNSQMTVLWQMPSSIGCTLVWGTDTTYSTGSTSTSEYGTDHQHKYTITGLTPGTKYYYRITAGAATATGNFITAPAASATKVKFMAYGDTRTNAGSHDNVCAGMNSVIAGDPEFQTLVLHSGDWVESDAETNWSNEFFNRSYLSQIQTQATMPIMGCLGNHELTGTGLSIFDKYWPYTYAGDHYYSFDYGPVHISVLDQETSNYAAGSPQLTWLSNDLASTTKKWKVVMFHEPGWCAGGSHPNNATVQTAIQPICEQYGVSLVFAGHNHYYSRAVVNGVHHITTGAGGAPFYSASAGQPNIVTYTTNALEFCKVAIDGNSLLCTTVKPDGTVLDTFYVDKEDPEFTFAQVTDVQIGMEASQSCPGQADRFQDAINKINSLKPAFVIDTGDHVQNFGDTAALTTYQNIAATLKPSIPLYHIPGNHDVGDTPTASSYTRYLSLFGGGRSVPWYSFSVGDTLFICLDTMILKSSTGYPGKDTEEMNWLTTTLQNASDYNNIIVFEHISLCLTSTTEADQSFNMPTAIRNQLLNLFHTYGVKAVICGHYHVPAYVNDNGLQIFTSESTTCPLGGLPVESCGIGYVKVYHDHIEYSYIPLPQIPIPPLLQGDFNGDGIVNFKDLGIFTGYWLDRGIWP